MRTTAVLAAALALFVVPSVAAQLLPPLPTGIEQVLVPISVDDVAGANGSLWTSELWVVNGGDKPLGIFALPCVVRSSAGCEGLAVPPRTSARLPTWGTSEQPGVMLMLSQPASFTLHVRDRSRQNESWGTEVPVVRERNFLTSTANLTAIPAGPAYRQTLRLYASINLLPIPDFIDPSVGDFVCQVRLYAITAKGDELIREREVRLPRPTLPPNQIASPLAQLTITDLFAGTEQYERLRISIEPLQSQPIGSYALSSFWAFVTATNNVTQQVTTVTAR